MKLVVWAALISAHIGLIEAYTPVSRGCDERSCYPATGNLLIGRQDKINASSTCGTKKKERYCILSHLDETTSESQTCFWCDSTPEGLRNNPRTSHRIQNIVYRWEPPEETKNNQYRTWWQSENSVQNVTVQFDLEAEFHVTHLIITYKSFRPAAMYIEKSYDWGKTWRITRYFAAECEKSFPGIRQGSPRELNETVCQTRYSKIVPSTFGTVIYRVLPPNINIHSPGFNPYSKEVQDLLKTTNIRIHMTQLHTMGDEALLQTTRQDVKEKYYYAIYDMTIRGSCSCYGHAEKCLPEKPEHENIEGMVHGKCNCTHNTMGNNCEYCLPDHNDVPWKPAIGKKKNECKKCDCNDHADSCYFNPDLYAATGNVSGGVCENCTHFTEGYHCEYCLLGFYQDPALPLNDPEICKPCDCEPDGTVDDGICDGKTDEQEDMVAGQCHCKDNVDGPRCDKCKNGYWNFAADNPLGCQACTCNIAGIVSNDGCDQVTGDCKCKRNVVGRDCDQCTEEHYGLSESDPNGCQPCDCNIGGSYDNNCDVISGQCKCRPHVTGRRCDNVADGYFTGALDYLLFEGELANGSQSPPTTVIKRMPKQDPKDNTWTGFGFMQVNEGSTLTFDIPAIYTDLEYDLVVRHEHDPKFPNPWENANVELVRIDGPVNPNGRCNETQDGKIPFSMGPDNLYTEIPNPICLEEGQRYQLKFTFDQYDPGAPDPKANILIDSIALIPKIETLATFDKIAEYEDPADDGETPEYETDVDDRALALKQAYEDNNCRELYIAGQRPSNVSEDCEDILKSISMFSFDGGINKKCECDNTGSESSLCDKYTGQCPCKKNVAGRQCSRCSPGFYGFGADGCAPCNCHAIGALDSFCREGDGQCNCAENAYGRQCNECQPGYWNFPNCQPCECNGHAPTCDAATGECINCGDATMGVHCEVCLDGFYGDPTLEGKIPCKECPCPNTKASGHSFADYCYLDRTNNEPVCECFQEYTGTRCSECADNYFGNPQIPGGSCIACNCSGNVILEEAGNCDPSTGVCLKCQYNTEGDHCEYCKLGWYGNAIGDVCKECVCDILGTDPERFECDRFTGDCHCLPNVVGKSCDRCEVNHWKIASGQGCEPCACDPVGSTSETCDEYTGECACKEGFGGRQCDQCQENFFGDPQVECFPCNCNPLGSQSFQCDHVTGKCICLEGIGGEKCDECDRGYVQDTEITPDFPVRNKNIPEGEQPQCLPCGECFTNWDRILSEMRDQTTTEVAKAEQVKAAGVTGAYYKSHFEEMEEKLAEVRDILAGASISNEELSAVQDEINTISDVLSETTGELDELDLSLADTKQSILQAKSTLEYLKTDADRRKIAALEMKENITKLQEANVEGALNLTKKALDKSMEAKQKVDMVQMDGGYLANSETQRRATETLMNNSRDDVQDIQSQNKQTLNDIMTQISNLESKIPSLNKQVCDGQTSVNQPCDSLCGGAGCGKCGGISCLNGALSKAEEAVKSAEAADKLLLKKEREAEQVLLDMTKAHNKALEASREAQAAHDLAAQAKDRSVGELELSTDLSKKIEAFTSDEQASPADVQTLANECLNAEMNLDQTEIENLAVNINNAIVGVAEVDQILADTADDLVTAEDLKVRAETAQAEAKAQLTSAENVTKSLSQAAVSQDAADIAVSQTKSDIDDARSDLGSIQQDMDIAVNAADKLVFDVQDLALKQRNLQTKYIKNENRVTSATDAALKAKTQADKANTELYQLNSGFKNVIGVLEGKTASIGGAKDLAVDLQRRANELAAQASNKLSFLRDVELEFEENERRLTELSSQLVGLNCEMMIHLQIIEEKSNYYRICTPPGTWSPSSTCTCSPGAMNPDCTSRRDVSMSSYEY